jgi:hypothetical protein
MIDCARIPFPIEISAKILYLAGAMDLGVNARKYLQVNPRKIEELESTYSKLYKICKMRSEQISNTSIYDFISRRIFKKNKRIIFCIYHHDDDTDPFIRYYRFMSGDPRGVLCGNRMREEVIRHTV